MKTTKPHNHLTTKPQAAVAQPAAITDNQAADALRHQYAVVIESEKACFRERVKFGVMLIEWERFLGEARGGQGGGASAGLKGWLEKNCPDLGYHAAMGYKTMAERALKMLGGGAVVTAALLGDGQARQPDGEVVEVPTVEREKCEKFFEVADSRRKLEQMWFEFAESERRAKRKRKAAEAAAGAGMSDGDAATVMWADAMSAFEKNRAAFHSAARDLKVPVARRFLEELKMLVSALERRIGGK